MVIKTIKELQRKIEKQSKKLEVFKEELENIKRNWIITKEKNTLERINRLNDTEEWISELEDSSGNYYSWTEENKKRGQF